MADIHELQFRVNGTKAVERGLFQVGDGLEQVNRLSGKTDKELGKVEKQIVKAAQSATQGARTIGKLRDALREASAQITRSARETTVLSAKVTRLTRDLSAQKDLVRTQKGIIETLARSNVKLAASYDKVAQSANHANAAQVQRKPLAFSTSQPLSRNALGGFTPGGTVALKEYNKTLAQTATAATAASRGVKANASDFGALSGGLNALRYQLFGVTMAYGIIGAAALKAGTAIISSGIEFDKNFANVIRTSQVTGQAVGWLKDQFLDLQSTIPVTAADLATIGTLGSQMGVSAAQLADFTRVTAEFSATSGTSVDEAATALSRLDQLLPDVNGNYERLASTILLTGVNAVATEQQIVRGTSQIAAMGRIAGLTTPEIVALSSTLSSLGFSPELQRSVITSSFSRILTATSTVTAQTEKFGAVLNLTGKEFQQAWNEDAIGTYERLMKTIAGRGDAVTVLQSLGLASQRLTPNLLKLGQNTEVLDEALRDTARGWQQNSELARQYGIISDTVSARTQVLSQAWDALLVTLDSSSGPLKFIIESLTNFVKMLRTIAKNPAVSAFATVGTAVVAVAGAMTLATAATAGLAAGYITIYEAQAGLTALMASNVPLTLADAEAATVDAAAHLGLGEAMALSGTATSGNTAALVGNTVALDANAASSGLAGSGLLRFSSGIISSLPSILKWTGIIGLAAAAITGLGVAIATAPDWTLDLDKMIAGADTAPEQVTFDTTRIKQSMKEIEDGWRTTREIIADAGGTDFAIDPNASWGIAFNDWLDNPDTKSAAAKKDISDVVEGLTTYEEKMAAVNQISHELGVTQEDLLTNILPDLGSVLGENAVAMAEAADETTKLEAAQSLWAASLGTSDENLATLTDNVKSAAGSFLDFGEALTNAYDTSGDEGTGGGLSAFLGSITDQIGDFESFYANLGSLVQKGGVQLASFFAAQGPGAAQALTDSLKLTPTQLGEIEEQMSLAAFYASDAFADTFAQNNSLLATIWEQSGHNSEAVAAFNKALQASMKGGSVDPAVIASLAQQYGIELPVGFIPDIDEDQFSAALALAGATVTPVKVPVAGSLDQGVLTQQVDAWVVSMEGHSITLPVDPNTDEGRALIAQWRANEYQTPLSIRTFANVATARAQLDAFHTWFKNLDWTAQAKASISYAVNSGSVGSIPNGQQPHSASGSMMHNNRLIRNNYPGYAKGAVFRGPGSGTSDSMLVRVSNGEAITRARAVRHYGSRMMEDINRLRFPKFNTGGFVGGPGSSGLSGGTVVHATVVQNYPTTRDPIKTLKRDAEDVLAGIWS